MRPIRYTILLMFLLLMPCVWADTVILKSGKKIEGEILISNDDVVLIRDTQGQRYQYPSDKVQSIKQDEFSSAKNYEKNVPIEWNTPIESVSPVAMRLDAAVEAAYFSGDRWGTSVGANLQIGSRSLAGKRIYLGGSVGYKGYLGDRLYSFVPVQAVISVPVLEGKHAPEVGFGFGYGIAFGNIKGGLCTTLDLGYRYQMNAKSAFVVGLRAGFQQAGLEVKEEVDNLFYVHRVGCNLVSVGLHLSILL